MSSPRSSYERAPVMDERGAPVRRQLRLGHDNAQGRNSCPWSVDGAVSPGRSARNSVPPPGAVVDAADLDAGADVQPKSRAFVSDRVQEGDLALADVHRVDRPAPLLRRDRRPPVADGRAGAGRRRSRPRLRAERAAPGRARRRRWCAAPAPGPLALLARDVLAHQRDLMIGGRLRASLPDLPGEMNTSTSRRSRSQCRRSPSASPRRSDRWTPGHSRRCSRPAT